MSGSFVTEFLHSPRKPPPAPRDGMSLAELRARYGAPEPVAAWGVAPLASPGARMLQRPLARGAALPDNARKWGVKAAAERRAVHVDLRVAQSEDGQFVRLSFRFPRKSAKRPRKSFGGDGEYEEPSYTPSGSSSRPRGLPVARQARRRLNIFEPHPQNSAVVFMSHRRPLEGVTHSSETGILSWAVS